MQSFLHPLEQTHWQQFMEAMEDRDQGLYVQQWPEAVVSALPKVLTASNFVAQQLLNHPEFISELLEGGQLWSKQSKLYYARQVAEREWLEMANDAFDDQLRLFRNRAYVRIIWRDSLGLSTLTDMMQDLSDLANVLIKLSLRYHTNILEGLHGRPVDADGKVQEMVVIAMGKLGANELNLSSDVDLIFAYPEDGDTQLNDKPLPDSAPDEKLLGKKSLSNHEFFTRLGRRMIHSLSHVKAEGFVFRVDMRLRPFGDSGALVSSFAALENYYLDQGRPWERYALIKARAVTGDYEQIKYLFQFLNAFVYRRYVDYGVINDIREMKALINREVLRQGDVDNVKTGTGGIREIEFIVQIFQLIRGGQKVELRTNSLLSALNVLSVEHMLPESVVQELKEAYTFLRRTEHAIQAFDDRQTHSVPTDEMSRARLAYVLGFSSWHLFAQVLERHRNSVRQHFAEMVKPEEDEVGSQDLKLELFQAWWLGELAAGQVNQLLEGSGFSDAELAHRILMQFREVAFAKPMQRTSLERIDQLMPMLLSKLSEYAEANTILDRIVLVLERVLRRSSYISLLIERTHALEQLITLCRLSPWIAEELARFPHLLDELLYDFRLIQVPSPEDLNEELRQSLLRVPEDDLESQMEILRQFKNVHRFHAAIGEIMQVFHVTEVSDYLTHVAEAVLQAALDISANQLIQKHGLPGGEASLSSENPLHILVIAYGKMGSKEMSYGSDLDLVFAYQADSDLVTQGAKPIENPVFYARLAQRLIHVLTTTTHGGRLYEVDTRLRPSGESGLLVCQFHYISRYMFDNAWTWEHQALVRARGVAGHPELKRSFDQLRREILCLPRPERILQIQVVNMRAKMMEHLGSASSRSIFDIKQDAGGLIDIEFIVQYGVLLYAQKYPELVKEVGTLKILNAFIEFGLLSETRSRQLSDAYKEYRAAIHLLTIQNLPSTTSVERFEDHRRNVRAAWREFVCGTLDA